MVFYSLESKHRHFEGVFRREDSLVFPFHDQLHSPPYTTRHPRSHFSDYCVAHWELVSSCVTILQCHDQYLGHCVTRTMEATTEANVS
mmetsp:Transcript_8718/g.13020  ORF Transcript_8718/g.13020 Transcript_8718/m.13020 type:complete len:88 (+) Transcript_8718:665-928(+)